MKMKKISFILFILVFVFSILFFQTGSAFAATLDNVQVNVSKNKIVPGEQVTVSIDFGKALGAYTANIAYDNTIFDYVSSEGGTHDDNGTRVKLVYYDSTGGTNPRTNATVTFKAKDSIITSNPTNFAITLEGLANSDASETYDDITTPIEKDVLVEPKNTEVTDEEEQTPSTEENPSTTPENNTTNETPNSLPKTGNTHYILIFSVIGILAGLYFITVKRKN